MSSCSRLASFFFSLAPSIVSVPLCACLSVHILKMSVGEQFLQQANKIMNDSLFLVDLKCQVLVDKHMLFTNFGVGVGEGGLIPNSQVHTALFHSILMFMQLPDHEVSAQ